jgi:hypothetical protein
MADSTLVADQDVIDFHKKVLLFAIFVNKEISKIRKESEQHPMASAILHKITADAVALHQSVLTLCSGGWAFAVPLLLRTLLDILASVLVIVNAKDDVEYMAFRCSHFYLKAGITDITTSNELRLSHKAQIASGIKSLPTNLQDKAKNYIYQDKMRGYWYSPEYSNAKKIFNKYDDAVMKGLYDYLSGASHGGLLGLSLFKDSPDDIHPNPRADKRSQNGALLSSSRLILDISGYRGKFESSGTDQIYLDLFGEINSLKDRWVL